MIEPEIDIKVGDILKDRNGNEWKVVMLFHEPRKDPVSGVIAFNADMILERRRETLSVEVVTDTKLTGE
jgi:hypothetical protein